MKIFKIFPWLSVFFSTTGISSSEAQRVKEKNKNESSFLLETLQYSSDRVHSTRRLTVSASAQVESQTDPKNPHKIEDFDVLEQVIKLNQESAQLGLIKFLEDIRVQIQEGPSVMLGNFFDIKKRVVEKPKALKATVSSIEYFCALDKVEHLIQGAGEGLVAEIGHLFKEALIAEAKAAVLGNQYNNAGSLLRRISSMPKQGLPEKTTLGDFILIETKELFLDKEEFKKKELEIGKAYDEAQMERNSFVKQIKDAARRLDFEYKAAHQSYAKELAKADKEFEDEITLLRSELLQEVAALKLVM